MYNLNIKEDLSLENFNGNNYLPWLLNPFQLWSLEDMLKVAAEEYVKLGMTLRFLDNELYKISRAKDPLIGGPLKLLIDTLITLKGHCDKLDLKVYSTLLSRKISSLSGKSPTNALMERGAIATMVSGIIEEMKHQLFLYVPPHRSSYFRWGDLFIMPLNLLESFPNASNELVRSGKCYAMGEYTACVFHSMRAAEIGLRALAQHLNVTFPYEITLAEWNALINKIDSELRSQQQLPKSEARDEELKFCSDAASQFRYFKNAYRIFVAHARESYDEERALSIMERTREFVESLSSKLSEPEGA